MPNRTLFASLSLAFAWLCVSRLLPLEADVSSSGGPAWFVVKSSLTFAALIPVLGGWGWLGLRMLSPIAARFGEAKPNLTQTGHWWLWTLTAMLLGVAVIGWVSFVSGLVLPPSWWTALPLVVSGYGLAGFACQRQAFGWPQATVAYCRSGLHRPSGPEDDKPRALYPVIPISAVIAVIAVIAVRISGVYFFQGHEDAYIYHLSLAESWIQRGRTGVFVSNLYSGYALAVEHYYLFLKLLCRGNAEQNALAQLSHVLIGYGTFIAGLMVLAGPWLRRGERLLFLLICLHTWLIFFVLLPKNDGFLAATIVLGLVGMVRSLPLAFLAGAALAMIMKPTAGLSFTALGAAMLANALAIPAGRAQRVRHTVLLLAAGAVLMVLVWLPFGWRNTVVTGDPFFPLLKELFPTPYAPGLVDVIAEAEPLALRPTALVRAFFRLFTCDALIIVAALSSLIALGDKQSRHALLTLFKEEGVLPTLLFIAIGFVFLQIFMGEYGKHVEPRHYLAIFGPLLILAAAALLAPWRTSRRPWLAPVLVAVLGLGYSNLDVAARDLYRSLTGGNLTAAFFARKPNMLLNAYLASVISQSAETTEPTVYATTMCRADYFLYNADFWHPMMSYPVWTWHAETLLARDLLHELRDHQVGFVITEDRSALAIALGENPGATAMKEVGGVSLWRLR